MNFKLDADSRAWVTEVSARQKRISERLISLGFLRAGEDDDVSHALAEVSYCGEILNSKTLSTFLTAEGEALSEVSVDLMNDLQEMRESLEAMQPGLIKLMNFLNP